MQIIKPRHEYLSHEGKTSCEFIETIGRTCYKSTDKITEGSAEKFVRSLIKSRHLAMIEHDTMYTYTDTKTAENLIFETLELDARSTSFFKISFGKEKAVISANLRSLLETADAYIAKYQQTGVHFRNLENLLLVAKANYPVIFETIPEIPHVDDGRPSTILFLTRDKFEAMFADEPQIIFKHLTHSILFVCDRGVSHEFVRHRPCSFAQESTRYCNYVKDKFGNEITVIKPFFYEEGTKAYNLWKQANEYAEKVYIALINGGSKPQEARSVLPNSLKTELIMTATEEEWQHIINLRALGTTGAPHPQMVEVMKPCAQTLYLKAKGRIRIQETT